MRNKELLWFRLFNTHGFGLKSIHYVFNILRKRNQTIEDFFKFDETEFLTTFPELGQGRFSKVTFWSVHEIESDDNIYHKFEELEEKKIKIIGLDDARYPKDVFELMNGNSPPVLFCMGNLQLLSSKGVSIVGAREVNNDVVLLTKEIAKSLADAGYNVTSGYAKGVDTSAHIGALEAEGTTTMILSFGVNHISIKRDIKNLDWEKNGLFITQFAPYEKFTGQNAMARNKLVCAMSKAVIVMQSGAEYDSSGKKSGTFDAGKSALDMGLPVFVLSPKIVPNAKGNQDLIKCGGREFDNVNQIINYLNSLNAQRSDKKSHNNTLNVKKATNISIQLPLF